MLAKGLETGLLIHGQAVPGRRARARGGKKGGECPWGYKIPSSVNIPSRKLAVSEGKRELGNGG